MNFIRLSNLFRIKKYKMKEKYVHINFLDVPVSVRFSGKGLRWYKIARKFFSGFLSSDSVSKKTVSISEDSFIDFWRGYKRALSYIIRKKMKSGNLAFIHASVVCDSNTIYIFIGKSGFGKSTICKILYQGGYRFITDDTLIFDVKQKKILVFPKPIELKKPYEGGKKFLFYFPEIGEREILIKNKKIMFFFLRNKIESTQHYRRFIKIVKSGFKEQLRKLNNLDGVIKVLKSTANLKNLDSKAYIKIISKRGNEFYTI